jgi:release factor glutamine methyltransferase
MCCRRDLLQQTINKLDSGNACSGRADAQTLMTYALDCRIVDLYTDTASVGQDRAAFIEQITARRAAGEPLQYITGQADFYGYKISLQKGVFIPRPETEILVETIIRYVNSNFRISAAKDQELNILDLCTGSGNIAISLTKIFPECKITSSDISDIALDTAKKNAMAHGVYDRIKFLKADFLDLPRECGNGFDIISCNPPYIPSKDIRCLPLDVRSEPLEALDGGIDGMDFYRILAQGSHVFLKRNGLIAIEIPDNSSFEIEEIFKAAGFYSDIIFSKDLNNIKRVATARLCGL